MPGTKWIEKSRRQRDQLGVQGSCPGNCSWVIAAEMINCGCVRMDTIKETKISDGKKK